MHASFGKGVRLLNFTFLKIKFTSYRFSPSTEKPSTEKPSTEKPSTEKPITEKPITEKPSTNNTDKSHFMRRNTQPFRRWLYLYPKATVKADLRHFHLISNTLYGWYWCYIYLLIKKSRSFQQMSDYNVFCCLVTFKPYFYLIRAVCRRNACKCLLLVPFSYKKTVHRI